jgi:agmatine/peptidylarginine deiminase
VVVPDNPPLQPVYNNARSCLSSRGFSTDDLNQINWYFSPRVDSVSNIGFDIWIRDYGPEILVTPDGSYQFVDMGYYSGPALRDCQQFGGRPNSDVSPTMFASGTGVPTPTFVSGVDTFRPALRTEGGNLQTDGLGTCVHMQRDVLAQNNFGTAFPHGWHYTQSDLDSVYQQFYNCSHVITLQSLEPDPQTGIGMRQNIDHVDMFMTFISQSKVLVGQFADEDAAFDPTNAAILDNNAQTLSDAGYNVVRIPMPRRYCVQHRPLTGCISFPGDAKECTSGFPINSDRVWATYANSIRIGNKMMVPVYHEVPDAIAEQVAVQEMTALNTFQTELDNEFGPGAVEVVPIVSDRMINCLGSVHCISMTYGPAAMP